MATGALRTAGRAFFAALAATTMALPLSAAAQTARSALPADPLKSPMWAFHAQRLLAGAPIVFDPAVRLLLPAIAENQHVFPVTVDARTLPGVTRILVYADLNPITEAVDYRPLRAAPYLS
ncbi:MAG TPA: thiosulfate oxidation carrier protein SoxY, partial [Novosphingobium sp.]|nr:thiosulfate oxidation carrier protein SoxY [Novosphingobium sp.]